MRRLSARRKAPMFGDSIGDSSGVALPTELVLRRDSRIPLGRQQDSCTGRERHAWQRPYKSRFLELETDSDRRAWPTSATAITLSLYAGKARSELASRPASRSRQATTPRWGSGSTAQTF